ncbi:MAG: cytochrome c biogenesis protein ResB [Promethearchaeota archaeon]
MVNETKAVKIPRELDILDTLWRLFSSTQLAAVVLLTVALASALGALFTRAPSQATFDVYGSWWFISLLALLAFGLIIGTAERVASLWPSFRQSEIKQSDDSFVDASRQAVFSVDQPAEQLVERLKAVLIRQLCRVLVKREEGMVYLYADRLWVEVAALLGHVGLIVVLAGVAVTGRLGWQEDAVTLSPGQSYEVGHGLDAVLRFEKLELDTYPDGSSRNYRAYVQLIEHDAEVERIIGVNRPFTYRGVSVYQISHGMAVAVKASDQDGQPLLLQSFADGAETAAVLSLPFGGHQSERYFAVPAHDIAFQLVFYQSLPDHGYDGPVFLVQAYRGSAIEPIYSRFIDKSSSLKVGGVAYHLALDQYSEMRIVSDPAVAVLVLGLLLTVVGYFLYLYWSPIRFWAAVSEKGDRATVKLAGTAERGEADFASWFKGLTREIERQGKDG